MENYKNIRIRKLHLDGYFAGTPLQQWYHCSDWNYGEFYIVHLSDALRLLTLFKYRGYYFDLDIIHFKSIEKVLHNFFVNQLPVDFNPMYNNAALHVDSQQQQFLSMALEEFRITYR